MRGFDSLCESLIVCVRVGLIVCLRGLIVCVRGFDSVCERV